MHSETVASASFVAPLKSGSGFAASSQEFAVCSETASGGEFGVSMGQFPSSSLSREFAVHSETAGGPDGPTSTCSQEFTVHSETVASTCSQVALEQFVEGVLEQLPTWSLSDLDALISTFEGDDRVAVVELTRIVRQRRQYLSMFSAEPEAEPGGEYESWIDEVGAADLQEEEPHVY